ncbi:hypothetical protein [Paracraurococcus lichenis]|uniref:MarR family transcriptional regulator n=1 Tax=Paracraurococcus lichenis TaxID=3064888 RepID=A0ABT9E8H9_9PROT|nr:hypothetical protein [Paracraurococcus sp. LOR1-02]MDO9712370.1 hypothetical protein [Paracraurococcus sp. LOR1-02]
MYEPSPSLPTSIWVDAFRALGDQAAAERHAAVQTLVPPGMAELLEQLGDVLQIMYPDKAND